MKRWTLALLALAALIVAKPSLAATGGLDAAQILRIARSAVIVPAQWDGIYSVVDTMYDCTGAEQFAEASTDTICGGKDYEFESVSGITCSGTADASSFDATCSGSTDVFTGCTANYAFVVHSTLASGTFHTVGTMNITYTGSAPGCSAFPATCTQTDSWGTRTGPAPVPYCATATVPGTWGQLKIRYH